METLPLATCLEESNIAGTVGRPFFLDDHLFHLILLRLLARFRLLSLLLDVRDRGVLPMRNNIRVL